jgi:type VI secretion system protein ImpK
MRKRHTLAVERRANLAMAFQELFTAIVRLRFSRQSAPNAEVFRSRMREAYRLATKEAQTANYSARAAQKAGYAVIAFLDESVVGSRNTAFANWSLSPLQKELFPDISGETFFHTIDELLAAPDSQEDVDILEVFLLALLLGYQGRYSIGGADELAAIIHKMKDKVGRVRGTRISLSSVWTLPDEPIAPAPPDPVRKTCFAVAVASLAACLVTFVVCKFLLLSGAGQIHSLLQR